MGDLRARHDEDSTSLAGLLPGTYVTNPEFGSGGASDTHEIAVVLLQAPAGSRRPGCRRPGC